MITIFSRFKNKISIFKENNVYSLKVDGKEFFAHESYEFIRALLIG